MPTYPQFQFRRSNNLLGQDQGGEKHQKRVISNQDALNMKQSEDTSTSFQAEISVNNQISKRALGKTASREQELSRRVSDIIIDQYQQNSFDYTARNFAFRDVDKNIDLLLDPANKAGEMAFPALPIALHANVENIKKLENFCRNNVEDSAKRKEVFDILLLSITRCSGYRNQVVDKLISFIYDHTLSLDLRTKSTQALLKSGTKDSLMKCQAIASDPSFHPEIRIAASPALNYVAKDILKGFIFNVENSDRLRILALQNFTVLHDDRSLAQILKIARGENNESAALRLAALQASMFSKLPELKTINCEIIKNCPANLRTEALTLLRAIDPQEMIVLAKEILLKSEIPQRDKFGTLLFLKNSALSKNQTITEYLTEQSGKESTQKFLNELPPNINDIFKYVEFKEKSLAPGNATDNPTPQQIISARNYLKEIIEKNEKLFLEKDGLYIDQITKSNQPEDRALSIRLLEYPNCYLGLKYQIATRIGQAASDTVERLMLQNRSYLEVVDLAEILFLIDRPKGLSAFRELFKDPTTFREILNKCFKLRDTDLIDMITQGYHLADSNNPESRGFLKSLGEQLKDVDCRKQFNASILRIAKLEKDEKKQRSLKQWAKDLEKCEKLGIEHPLRLKPETLSEIISNREQSSEGRKKDKRDLAIICMPKADYNGFAYAMRNEIEGLRSKGYRLMFYEVDSRDSLIKSVNDAASSGKAQNLILIGHGTRDAIAFSANDPGQGHLVDSSNGLTIKDAEALKKNGFGNCLKQNGRILLISCSVGAGAGKNENLANMMRDVVPHALPKGIVAPTAPTIFQGFIFDKNNKLRDFETISERYKAFNNNFKNLTPDTVTKQQKFAA